MRKLCLAGLMVLCGCALDRLTLTEFEPNDGGFRYVAPASAVYPADKDDVEAVRVEWLEQYLRDNKICPSGYEITDRKVIYKGFGGAGRIYYYGRCGMPKT
jgi:hypothetical protein